MPSSKGMFNKCVLFNILITNIEYFKDLCQIIPQIKDILIDYKSASERGTYPLLTTCKSSQANTPIYKYIQFIQFIKSIRPICFISFFLFILFIDSFNQEGASYLAGHARPNPIFLRHTLSRKYFFDHNFSETEFFSQKFYHFKTKCFT